MIAFFWWLKHIGLICIACVFLVFGIQLVVAAYTLDDPFAFVLTFFASNLMILISAVLMIGFIWRVVSVFKKEGIDKDGE